MTVLWRASYSMLAAAALGLVCVPDAGAQTMEPLPYTNVPIGLNFLIVGYHPPMGQRTWPSRPNE